ncbi:MAG TPA: GNAT family N-acetyltransferase [Ardenticatenaceae bacterium]|jgi:predicted GNAT family acetyltransferase
MTPKPSSASWQQTPPCNEIFSGKSYTFPNTLTPADYPDVTPWNESHRSLPGHIQMGGPSTHLIIADGQIASACESSRENHKAGEAWVQTSPHFRRRGYARQVTAAWARYLQQQGKIPLYSHQWDNAASEAVARSLGLVPFITFVAYT